MRKAVLMLLALTCSSIPAFSQADNFYYDEGLKERGKANYDDAAAIWKQGSKILSSRNMGDPRMGIAFIEMVTNYQLKDYYEDASQAYLESFNNLNFADFEDIINREIAFLSPLLKSEKRQLWMKLIENKDSALGQEIRKFWFSIDPIPSTLHNERLTEHWERIHYARKTFTESEASPYGTDERGTVFVKYGDPEILDKGLLPLKGNHQFVGLPEHEIWIYKSLDQYESVIFVFGRPEGSGFRMLKSVEDFIPEKFFNLRLQSESKEGSFLQRDMYRYLAPLDPVFKARYNEIRNAILAGFAYEDARSIRNRFVSRDYSDPVKISVEPTQSLIDKLINSIDIKHAQMRILDEENVPQMLIYAVSFPPEMENGYQLNHNLTILDNDLNELNRVVDQFVEIDLAITYHTLDQGKNILNYLFYAEAFEHNVNNLGYPTHAGKVVFNNLPPLNTEIDKLEMSDLLIGTPVPEDLDEAKFPIPLVPGTSFTQDQDIDIYLELYHLFFGSDNKTHYTINYKISKKDREYVAETLTFEDSKNRTRDKITIDINNLDEGRYDLIVEARDIISGQSISRQSQIEIRKR